MRISSSADDQTYDPDKGYVALLGWSLAAVESVATFDRRYVVVAPDWAHDYCEQHDIPYVPWNFERLNDRSFEIAQTLQEMGVDVAIPLFEETVEWAGAINSVLLDNPRLFGQSMLLRDKALMKRRAQLGGIRVGIFEEAHDREDVVRFLKRVNQTLLKLDGDPDDPIHLKAFDKAGSLGHRIVRTPDDVDLIPDDEFPVNFFNPNDDSGQDWGDGVVVSTAGNGERPGESSLPFAQLASRLYIFHVDPLEQGDPEAVPDEEIAAIVGRIDRTWGAERRPTAGLQADPGPGAGAGR